MVSHQIGTHNNRWINVLCILDDVFFALMCIVNVDQVKSIVENGVNVNEIEKESGFAPLHYSAGAGKLLFSFF